MLKKYNAKSLFQLLISLIIIIIIILAFNSQKNLSLNKPTIMLSQLKTLQYLLNLTRSEAIQLSTKTYLCPTKDHKTCLSNWDVDIMIFTVDPNLKIEILHYFINPFRNSINSRSRLKFFGNNKEPKIAFLPNGLTVNNGHFCTDLKNLYCLYINQAGKISIKVLDHNNK